MRKALPLLFTLLPCVVFGQLEFGIKTALDHYWFSKPPVEFLTIRFDYSPGWSLAAFLRYDKKRTIVPDFEVRYSSRSFNVVSSYGGADRVRTIDYNYTIGTLYLQFRPQFGFGSKTRFYVYPGVYYGILINSLVQGSYSDTSHSAP